jgi:hypothetical protein
MDFFLIIHLDFFKNQSCKNYGLSYQNCWEIFAVLILEHFQKAFTRLSRESGEEDQAHLLDREPTQLALCLRLAILI